MYQALYRKYRPAAFEDVISQPHITTTLKNQIINGKTGHAYLFTGSRGTGKTTCARIFAKAINCENPVNGSPCGKCSVCADADNFALSDIIEIDAASNGKVEDARELKEAAEYTPERCKYKVYIIDEVHMLSKEAFNALLKLIEEPPAHVKFIMATTELHKVLPTVLSRCQRFDFMRIKTEDMAARLREIAEKEGISLTEDASLLIAKTADGGMRDALSILDRCIAFSENVTAETVSEAAGIAGREYLFSLARAIADKDPAKALDITASLYDRSKDMQRLCEELSEQFRNIMIAISAPQSTGSIICLPSELETIKSIGEKMSLERVLFILDSLASCSERMTRSLSKRIDMEMCIIRVCGEKKQEAQNTSGEIAALNARIAELERQLKNASFAPAPSREPPRAVKREPVREISPSSDSSEFTYIPSWFDIIERMKTVCPSLSAPLADSYGYDYQGKLVINKKEYKLIKVLLQSAENKSKIIQAASEVTGMTFSTVLTGYRASLDRSGNAETAAAADKPSPAENLDSLLKKAESGGIPVETE